MFLKKLFIKADNKIAKDKLPVHIAIIPDGNGRWAAKRGLPKSVGHREGANTFKKIVKFCNKIGIKYLTLYTLSTENWKRPKNEVDALMSLLLEFLRNADKELAGSNIKIRVIGDTTKLSDELQSEIARVLKSTGDNTGLNLVFALNYGARDEMVNAIKAIAEDVTNGKIKIDDINEQIVSYKLYTAQIPDPDLLIRTSGEKRSSNFMLWQSAYTEFWYSDVLWPDFNEEYMTKAIKEFQNRNRRFGGV